MNLKKWNKEISQLVDYDESKVNSLGIPDKDKKLLIES